MRGIKSVDLLSIVDLLYYGEANVYQENLVDFFLAKKIAISPFFDAKILVLLSALVERFCVSRMRDFVKKATSRTIVDGHTSRP